MNLLRALLFLPAKSLPKNGNGKYAEKADEQDLQLDEQIGRVVKLETDAWGKYRNRRLGESGPLPGGKRSTDPPLC